MEAHLARNPNDARGYEVVAPVYIQLGRFADAVTARRKVLRSPARPPTGRPVSARRSRLTQRHRHRGGQAAFTRALTLDPSNVKAEFFTGIAAMQDGDRKQAAAIWQRMLDKAPPDAPWADDVRQALARLGGVVPPVASMPSAEAPPVAGNAPGPSAADVAAASNMTAQDRNAMIHAMVARLADRLKQNGGDIEGWQRLLRAYMVLNERDKAHAAASEARKALASDPDKLRQIEDTIKSLGLEG